MVYTYNIEGNLICIRSINSFSTDYTHGKGAVPNVKSNKNYQDYIFLYDKDNDIIQVKHYNGGKLTSQVDKL